MRVLNLLWDKVKKVLFVLTVIGMISGWALDHRDSVAALLNDITSLWGLAILLLCIVIAKLDAISQKLDRRD